MTLFGKAHFLLAASGVKGSDNIRADVCNRILAHAVESGGKFVFSEVIDDSYSRILSSALRTNGAVLSALAAYGRTDQGRQLVGDVPFKLVRTITRSRKNRDHWENTQENMFCLNALIDYSRGYESESPDMTLRVLFDAEELGGAKFTELRDDPVMFQKPIGADKSTFKHAADSWWFRYSDWSSYGVSRWSFYHQELRHNAVRFYSEYLPAGNYHLSYTAQAIAPGDFVVMPVYAKRCMIRMCMAEGGRLTVGR
jgi:hypothetical protein